MTTEEKLQRIRARCVELLAIAEKRTPGKWKISGPNTDVWSQDKIVATTYVNDPTGTGEPQDEHDAAFIAACAGPAEAGWRSTIAAIDGIYAAARAVHDWRNRQIEFILAAWPAERQFMPPTHNPRRIVKSYD